MNIQYYGLNLVPRLQYSIYPVTYPQQLYYFLS